MIFLWHIRDTIVINQQKKKKKKKKEEKKRKKKRKEKETKTKITDSRQQRQIFIIPTFVKI